MTARGERNNNPGNIDRNPKNKWLGTAPDQSSDPRFVVFTDAKYGIRAIAKLMMSYQHDDNLHTVRGLILRWAPPSENKSLAYVNDVAADIGVKPTDIIDVDSMDVMLPLVKAIITHENGENPYPDSLVIEALHLAGIADAPAPPPVTVEVPVPAPPVPPKPLHQQTSFMTKAGAGVTLAGGLAAQYAPTVKGWGDTLRGFADSPVIQNIATTMLTVAGMLLLVSLVSSVFKQKAAQK